MVDTDARGGTLALPFQDGTMWYDWLEHMMAVGHNASRVVHVTSG